ncbi:DUF4184 family protein [Streptomyces pathocidini]|uniref:DUF4184 family protein n=1 Tax=Streptomyces pathocidini TaxID=1650571 RepID=UPI0033C8BC31
MPFTLSHAAAVLPGIRGDGTGRGPLVASALVAGSFAPDLTYFADSVVPGAMEFGAFTHAPLGVLTVDPLVAALSVGAWLLLREPLLALVPRAWRGRAYGLVRGRPWHGRAVPPLLGWFWLSAVLGAVTHVVWDAFTHHGRWGTRLLPGLNETVAGLPLSSYAQYGSSALALPALAVFAAAGLRRLPRNAAVPAAVPVLSRRVRASAVGLLGLCALAGAVHRCVRAYPAIMAVADPSPLDFVPTALFGAGAGLALGLAVYAAAVRIRRRVHPESPPVDQEPGTRVSVRG